jgi:hypothetical protein
MDEAAPRQWRVWLAFSVDLTGGHLAIGPSV